MGYEFDIRAEIQSDAIYEVRGIAERTNLLVRAVCRDVEYFPRKTLLDIIDIDVRINNLLEELENGR